MSILYIRVAHPVVTLENLDTCILVFIITIFIQLWLTVTVVVMIKMFIPSKDDEEKQSCEDGYRRMGDGETVCVDVPLQVV